MPSGDLNGKMELAHAASAQGLTVASSYCRTSPAGAFDLASDPILPCTPAFRRRPWSGLTKPKAQRGLDAYIGTGVFSL